MQCFERIHACYTIHALDRVLRNRIISEMIKARLSPVPEVQLILMEYKSHSLLEVRVKAGLLTPYYYQDGTRTTYTRVGNESVECNSQTEESFFFTTFYNLNW